MKKQYSFLVSFAFILALNFQSQGQNFINNPPLTKTQWDLVFSFQTPQMGVGSMASDGEYIYTAEWVGTSFFKYDMEGNFIEAFEITGAGSIHDLAYDGQYFYGSNTHRNIQVLDLKNKTLINDFEVDGGVDVEGIRHITFDPTLDNNNGGFWIGNYHSLAAMDKNGILLISNEDTPELPKVTRGSAWDNIGDPANPKLWLFSEEPYPSSDVMMLEFDINSLSFTGVEHNISDLPGFDSEFCEAGGAFAYENDGKFILAGCSRHRPHYDIIFGYELYPTITENSPSAVTNFNAHADVLGNKEVTLRWTNPSTNMAGHPLTDLDSVVLSMNGTRIYTLNTPPIGEESSCTINTPSYGNYHFKAICYNSNGYSLAAHFEQFVGVDLSISQLNVPSQAHVNETIIPTVTVKNHSSSAQSFRVELNSRNYNETIAMDNVAPEAETTINFPEFTYTSCVTTIFTTKIVYEGTDFNLNNNEVVRSTMVTDGIEDISTDELQIYPNPVENVLNISTHKTYTINITNIVGESVYKDTHQGTNQIDLQNVAKGVYNVHIEIENRIRNEKIIKQ